MHNFEQSEEYLGIARVYQSNYAKHALYMHNFEQSEEYLGIAPVVNVPCICMISSSSMNTLVLLGLPK